MNDILQARITWFALSPRALTRFTHECGERNDISDTTDE